MSARSGFRALRFLLPGLIGIMLLSVLLAGFNSDTDDASPSVNNFVFESLDVHYTLGRADDGTSTLRAVETFVARFPDIDQNRGMRRAIPDSYNGQPNFPTLVSITDENGSPRAAETDSQDGEFRMTSRADGFVHGLQTYVFTYDLRNVTWSFADTDADEFYWNVNGLDWPQNFNRITARVTVPPELAGAMTGSTACYVGPRGSTKTCDIATETSAQGAEVTASSREWVRANESVTIAVGFDSGTFEKFDSSPLASPWGWALIVCAVGALGAVVFAFVVRRRSLADDPGRPTIIAEYTPPRGIDALTGAVLLGRTKKAIPAEVLEQAVVGSIRIVEGGKKLFGGVKLRAELVDPTRADGDGRILLDGIFPGRRIGSQFEFGTSDRRFSAAAQKMLKYAEKELDRHALRRVVDKRTRARPVIASGIALALSIGSAVFAIASGVDSVAVIVLVMVALVGVMVVVALISRKPLTARGAEVRDHLLGVKQFIEWAEADRIRMLQSPAGAERVPVNADDPRQMLKLYETLLPYAVVFGQEKEWAQQLAVLYGSDSSPSWYAGSVGFNAAAFSAGIGTLSASASASSSTSGGSGGGGSAGGGGGGGGGGGV